MTPHMPCWLAAEGNGPDRPWMGLRARLKASIDCNTFQTPAKVVCVALKRRGLILADVGRSFFMQGEASDAWEDGSVIPDLPAFWAEIQSLKGSDMEVVLPPGARLASVITLARS